MAPASGAQNTVDTAHVVAFLASLRGLRWTGPVGFVSAAGQPDVPVILALAGAPSGASATESSFHGSI